MKSTKKRKKKAKKAKSCPDCRAKEPFLKWTCTLGKLRSYASAPFGGMHRCKNIFHGGAWL